MENHLPENSDIKIREKIVAEYIEAYKQFAKKLDALEGQGDLWGRVHHADISDCGPEEYQLLLDIDITDFHDWINNLIITEENAREVKLRFLALTEKLTNLDIETGDLI